jgi:hypothetical protein
MPAQPMQGEQEGALPWGRARRDALVEFSESLISCGTRAVLGSERGAALLRGFLSSLLPFDRGQRHHLFPRSAGRALKGWNSDETHTRARQEWPARSRLPASPPVARPRASSSRPRPRASPPRRRAVSRSPTATDRALWRSERSAVIRSPRSSSSASSLSSASSARSRRTSRLTSASSRRPSSPCRRLPRCADTPPFPLPRLPSYCHSLLTRALPPPFHHRSGLPGGPLRGHQSVRNPRQACHHHAKGHPAGTPHPWRARVSARCASRAVDDGSASWVMQFWCAASVVTAEQCQRKRARVPHPAAGWEQATWRHSHPWVSETGSGVDGRAQPRTRARERAHGAGASAEDGLVSESARVSTI